MEDAGFIVGGYAITFGGIAVYAIAMLRRARKRQPRRARRGEAVDLTPRPTVDAPAAPRRKRKWLPMVVLGLVVVAGGVLVSRSSSRPRSTTTATSTRSA